MIRAQHMFVESDEDLRREREALAEHEDWYADLAAQERAAERGDLPPGTTATRAEVLRFHSAEHMRPAVTNDDVTARDRREVVAQCPGKRLGRRSTRSDVALPADHDPRPTGVALPPGGDAASSWLTSIAFVVILGLLGSLERM